MTDYSELKRLAEAHAKKDIEDPIESERVMLVEPKTVLDLIDENEALRQDVDRYRWLRDQKPNSLNLGRNSDHSSNYMRASEWIEQNPEWFDGTPEVDMERMASTDTIWQLQIYPHTPVGFNVLCRATLDDLIDSAMSEEG